MSKSMVSMQQLYIDLSQTGDVIPGCTRVHLALQHSSDAFRLVCPEDQVDRYKLVVEKVELIVTQCRLRDNIMKSIERKLIDDNRLSYHVNRILCTGPHQVACIKSLTQVSIFD